MRSKFVLMCATGVLAVSGTACGGDDAGGSGSVQDRVANELIAEARSEGMDLDEACVRQATSDLSDSDAQAFLDDDVEAPSDAATEVMVALISCVDFTLED